MATFNKDDDDDDDDDDVSPTMSLSLSSCQASSSSSSSSPLSVGITPIFHYTDSKLTFSKNPSHLFGLISWIFRTISGLH